jgi:tartrate-resistant acid phosphatase type 5
MVFIDTVYLSGDPPTYWPTQSQEQYAWINTTLAASTADWLFVVGHYPVYSGGEHGNTADLVSNLLPMLRKYNVDLYICGHDHNLQHLQDSTTSTQYLVSGNGAKRGSYSPIPQSKFGMVDPGFMLHNVMGLDNMTSTVIDLNGKTIYEYTQTRIPKKHDHDNALKREAMAKGEWVWTQ